MAGAPALLVQTIAADDTQYDVDLTGYTVTNLAFKVRGAMGSTAVVRYAFVTGKVAGADGLSSPVEPYHTIDEYNPRYQSKDSYLMKSGHLYLAGNADAVAMVVEIEINTGA